MPFFVALMKHVENITGRIQRQLKLREESNTLRTLKNRPGLVDFCSNDFLGFSSLPMPKGKHALGSTGSRLISGESEVHAMAEKEISEFHRAPAGLLFNSGYDANLGLISSVAKRGDLVLYDELVHASIRDGIRLSLAKSHSFAHNSREDLEAKLQKSSGQTFVIVESLYSMDGDEAPLKHISDLCETYGASLIVDEAHATGVHGENGRGLCVEHGIHHKTFARVYTFGKAIGSHGAIVVGQKVLRDFLINFCRPFIYTTALPPHSVAAIMSAYEELQTAPTLDLLHDNIALFLNSLSHKTKGYFITSRSPIQSVVPGSRAMLDNLLAKCEDHGFDIRAIHPPTVPEGQNRMRICLHSFNKPADIERLAQILNSTFDI